MPREEIPHEKEILIWKGLGSFILVAFSWVCSPPPQQSCVPLKTLQGKCIEWRGGKRIQQQKQTGETEVLSRQKYSGIPFYFSATALQCFRVQIAPLAHQAELYCMIEYFAHLLNEMCKMGKPDAMVSAAVWRWLETEPFVIKIVMPF